MKFMRGVWTPAFTLAGTTIGAGVLGLPYVFSKSGFLIGAFWILILGAIIIYTNLCMGEIVLRTKAVHQIPGYAKKYLGNFGKKVLLFAVLFGVYSALLAYLIGEGQSFSHLLFGTDKYAIHLAIIFWAAMTLLLREGLRGLKKVELYGVVAIIGIIILMLIWSFPNLNYNNLAYSNLNNLFLPFGIVLFSLLGFTGIPELGRMVKNDKTKLKKAIVLGTLIPIISYLIFCLIFLGILGKNIAEVSTISFGGFITLLGIFTMLTSYFVLSFVIRDIFVFDLGKRNLSFFFVSIFPLLSYILALLLGFGDFIKVLGFGGVISGGLTAVLVLLMNYRAKKEGDRRPEFSVPLNLILSSIIFIIFLVGVISLIP